LSASTLLTADESERPSAINSEVYLQKGSRNGDAGNEAAAGSGSLYCFVTETSEKVTL